MSSLVIQAKTLSPEKPNIMHNLGGPFQTTWAAFYIIGVPLGSYVSAKALKKFKWRVATARQLVTIKPAVLCWVLELFLPATGQWSISNS